MKEGKGIVWRAAPALREEDVELLLDYDWIIKGCGVTVAWPLGCWGLPPRRF